jgi:hypothetical protein
VAEEWEAVVKSSNARANVKPTGVNFGSEAFQVGTDHILTSVHGLRTSRMKMANTARRRLDQGQLEFKCLWPMRTETVFSVAKRKLSCRAPGRCLLTQRRQALLLGLTYNLYRL